MVASKAASFDACTTLGSGVLRVLWKAPAAPASDGNVSLQLGMEAPLGPAQWVALGFPARPATMIGASAAVLRHCPTCPHGAICDGFFLAAKSTSAVKPPARIDMQNLSASNNGAASSAAFTIVLPPGAISGGQLPVIYATGPLDPSTGSLKQHMTRGAATLDLASATATPAGDSPSQKAKKNAHGWLMTFGWLILLVGVVIATSFRDVLGSFWWFQVHRALQVLGMATVLTAYVLIFSALGGERTSYTLHFNLGTAAFALGCAQLTALVVRPHLDSHWRRAWALGHRWVGRSVVVLAIANIFYGIINVRHVGNWAVIAFSIVLGLIVGAGIVKNGVDYLRLPPPAFDVVSGPGQRGVRAHRVGSSGDGDGSKDGEQRGAGASSGENHAYRV